MPSSPASSAGIHPALLELLRSVPRRYRVPPLPADLEAALAAGSETTLAFTIESARLAMEQGVVATPALGDAFTTALGALIRRAMTPDGGDSVFQSQVLQSRDPQVRDWTQLESFATGDARAVRAAVDGFAHPGKLRDLPQGPRRHALSSLHARASAGEWHALASETFSLLLAIGEDEAPLLAGLRDLAAHPALQRRMQAASMATVDAVQRYRALRARRVPVAGSDTALDQGRASAREGAQAEHAAAKALEQVAAFLNDLEGSEGGAHRVLRTLLTPRELSGGGDRSKEEWDVAIVKRTQGGLCDLVLVAEVKAAPAAVTSDMPRLLRGLTRLAQAPAGAAFVFASMDGPVRLSSSSLRALDPDGRSLPAQVIYLCSAPTEARSALLGAAAKAVLLAEPASLGFASAIAAGETPAHADLMTVWRALPRESRLRAALYQYDTARRAREATLNTADLSAGARQAAAALPRQSAP